MGSELPPAHWHMAKLGELGEVNRGRSRHRPRDASHLYGGPYPFIQTGDIKNSEGRITSFTQTYSEDGLAQSRLWPAQTMCITIAANIAETALLSFPACFPDSVVGFIADKNKCDVRFIEYVFRRLRQRIQREATGSVQDNINLQTLARLSFGIPPLREQVAIADVLGALDDRIDVLRQTNTTLEAIAQALFKSWFVDFAPVHAKAESRAPEAMDAATAALFPSEFEQSELGLIPKGWRVDEIGNAVKCLGGGTPSTKENAYWTDGEFHWVTPKDLSGLQAPVLTTTDRKITSAGLSRISSGLLPVGTLLMSSRAPIGYLALTGISTAINQGFIAMPPGGTLPPLYLLLWVRKNMDLIKQAANGSTFMEVSKKAFRPIKLCIPSPELVDAFVAIASPLMKRIEANEHHRVMLAELRDTLLPCLISGKLCFPEATEAVEAALA